MPGLSPFSLIGTSPPPPPAAGSGDSLPIRGLGGAWILTGGLGAPAAGLPADLPAAIEARLASDPALSKALAGSPLAFWRDEAPTTSGPAYGVFWRAGSSPDAWTSTSEWKAERVRFRTFAPTGDQAVALRETLRAAVAAWGAIDYRDGYAIQPREDPGSADGKTNGRRAGDRGAFWSEVTFKFRCRRGR